MKLDWFNKLIILLQNCNKQTSRSIICSLSIHHRFVFVNMSAKLLKKMCENNRVAWSVPNMSFISFLYSFHCFSAMLFLFQSLPNCIFCQTLLSYFFYLFSVSIQFQLFYQPTSRAKTHRKKKQKHARHACKTQNIHERKLFWNKITISSVGHTSNI